MFDAKKKLIVIAIAGAFALPLAAQAQITFGNETIGTVQFYGKLYPQVISATSSGATQTGASVSTLVSATGVCGTSGGTGGCTGLTAGRRLAVDSQNSYIGFRGEKKFGSTGLKGIWQIEQAIELDTGNEDATFSNRDSFLGLDGGFGTVKLGNMDTIYKDYGQMVSMFGLTSGNFVTASNVLSHIGVGSNRAARFHERAPNSIQYETPEFGGVQAGLQYSPGETKNDVGQTLNRFLLSGGVKYETKQYYVSLQHERHNDFFGGTFNVRSGMRNGVIVDGVLTPDPGAHSSDSATRLSGKLMLGDHTLAGDIARLEWKESGQAAGTKFVSYQRNTWAVGWEAKWSGPWKTALQYVHAGDGTCALTIGACSTTGLKGTLIAAAVAYDLDRRTFLYVLAAKLTNGPSARHDNWAASSPARGGDVTQLALGMNYRF